MRIAPSVFSILIAIMGSQCLASTDRVVDPGAPEEGFAFAKEKATRSTDTCADPSLARTLFQVFHGPTTVHVINAHYAFVHSNTLEAAAFWTDQRPAFRGWASQQPFTVPLFQLGNSDRTEYIYLIGPDAQTPPIVSGFNTDVTVVSWVYDTPVCGSVPLMSAAYAPATDHYFTTDNEEHQGLVTAAGWLDTGIIAYVLPLTTC